MPDLEDRKNHPRLLKAMKVQIKKHIRSEKSISSAAK
jgi:hypothetical protein